ncbi:MAG TPA: site-specific integrase [Blastocatellia bacterium]|nr:site-specific integrase [Blastocatellia bacterium]
MKAQKISLIGPLIQSFFTQHLLINKRVSPQTVASYRDTLKLFLQYLKEQTGKEPVVMRVSDLDVSAVLSFLDHLEQIRHNSPQSRNVRLAAIRTFFRWVALREPEQIGLATRVLSIPCKRTDRRLVRALSRIEIDAVLAAPDLTRRSGRRDQALLLTLYNTGARVSEITELRRDQVNFGTSSFLQLYGKGRKERAVPLWPRTARILQAWFREIESSPHSLAFPSLRGNPLTRDGVNYVLQRAVSTASQGCPGLREKKISPHTLRHSTAMHLLQSGVDITVIALWLGHESIETTHIYLEADLETKERALNKLAPAGSETPRFKAQDEVLAFLTAL